MIVLIDCLIDSGRYIKVVYFTPVSIVYVLHSYSAASHIMAALWNRAGHYIFALWFLSFFLSFFLA